MKHTTDSPKVKNKPEPGEWSMLPKAVLPHLPEMRNSELRVYVAICLAMWWGKDQLAYITQAQIMEQTGLSRNTVKWAIRSLSERGLLLHLRRGRRRGSCSVYRILGTCQKIVKSQLGVNATDPCRERKGSIMGSTGVNATDPTQNTLRKERAEAQPPPVPEGQRRLGTIPRRAIGIEHYSDDMAIGGTAGRLLENLKRRSNNGTKKDELPVNRHVQAVRDEN